MKKTEWKKLGDYLEKKFFWTAVISLGLIISFIAISMAEFYKKAYEREYWMQVKSLEDLAAQGSMILENRLKGYINTLNGVAAGLQAGTLHTKRNMQELANVVGKEGIDFARMGIADENGYSWLTNGEEIDISGTSYFQRAMQGECSITEAFASRVVDETVFIAAVPVFDDRKQVKGVLYGAVEIEEFKFYKNTSMENALRLIQVIDKEGNYIVKSREENEIISEDNFFDGLRNLECSMSGREFLQKTSNGDDVLLQVRSEESEYVLFLSKLMVNDWYVVTILDKRDILGDVSYLLGKDIYMLVLKVGAAFAIVCAGSIWYMRRDKKQIEKLYNQLKLNEEMIRTAVAAGRSGILFYDVQNDRLKTITGKNLSFEMPKVVEHASQTLVNYLPPGEKNKCQVAEIFEKLHTIQKSDNLEFALEINGELRDYAMHVESIAGENDRDIHFVGIADDITEKTVLVKEMQIQENLFSSMVGFLVVDLDEDRILRSSKKFQEQYKVGEVYSQQLQKNVQANIDLEYRDYVRNMTSCRRLLECFKNNRRNIKLQYPHRSEEGKLVWMEGDVRIEQSKENGHCLAYIVFRDISDTKDTEKLLRERANKDYLTGLYNRRSTVEMIDQFLMQPSSMENSSSFVIFDLDNFKMLNDVHGHHVGDEALMDVAKILSCQFRKYDIVSRLAGDEFVLFLKNIPIDVTEEKVKELLKKLQLTYTKDGKSVSISASAGIAVAPECGRNFSTLYQNADKALYEAKNAGKCGYVICRQEQEMH